MRSALARVLGLSALATLGLLGGVCAGDGDDAADKALDLEAIALVCPETAQPPAIDGAIAEPAWKSAAAVRVQYQLGGAEPAGHPRPSTFLLSHDKTALYVAGQITEADGWKPPAGKPDRDGREIFGDNVELFLAPDFDFSRFTQFVISASGGRGDFRYGPDAAGREKEWNPDWRLAVKTGKDGWSFEAAIPFAALGLTAAPPAGHVWRLKIARLDPALGQYHYPWSPVRDNLNQSHYAPLVFKTRDLLDNGSFKQPGAAGKPPVGWVFATAPQGENPPLGSLTVVQDDGVPAVRVVTQVNDPRGLGPVLQSAPVQLQAGSDYELSFRVKGSGLRLLARYNTHLGKTSSDAAITPAYEPRVVRFHAQDARETAFRFCQSPAVAGASFDITDIRLVRQLRAAPSQAPMVRAHPIHRLLALAERNTWNAPLDSLKMGDEVLPQSLVYRDTATGTRVFRLLGPPYWARHVYSSMPPWNGDGSLACVSSALVDGKNLWILDARTWRVRRSPVYAGSRVWHPSEPRLLLVSGKTIKSYDAGTHKVSDFYTVPNAPCVLWYASSDRKKLLGWENWREGKEPRCRLWLFDMAGGEHASVEAPYWIHSAWLTKGADYACSFGVDEPVELRGKAAFDVDWKNRRVTRVADERTEVRLGSHTAFSPSGQYQCGSAFMVMDLATRKVWRVAGTDALNANHASWDVEDAWFAASGAMGCFRAGVFGRNYAQRINVANSALRGGDYYSEEHCVSSPDGTKLCFATNMLGNNESHWAVMRLPAAPRQLRAARGDGGVRLTWQAPAHAREIAGYAVYRSGRSGEGYTPVGGLVQGLEAVDTALPASEAAAYVVCSVETSGLESLPSNEAAAASGGAAWKGRRWVFAEAEDGAFSPSVAETFDAQGASGLLCAQAAEKAPAPSVRVAASLDGATTHVYLRARNAAPTEGSIEARAAGQTAVVKVPGHSGWQWLGPAAFAVAAGKTEIEFTFGEAGLALDVVALSDQAGPPPPDSRFPPPPAVESLSASANSAYAVRLSWKPAASPVLSHYNIYAARGREPQARQEDLIRSTRETSCLDWGLMPGQTYRYLVTAIDRRGAEGPASAPAQAATPALADRVFAAVPFAWNSLRQESGSATVETQGAKAAVLWIEGQVIPDAAGRVGARDKETAEIRVNGAKAADWTANFWCLRQGRHFPRAGVWMWSRVELGAIAPGRCEITIRRGEAGPMEVRSLVLTNDLGFRPRGITSYMPFDAPADP